MISFATFHFEINLLETETWESKYKMKSKLVAAKWGGGKNASSSSHDKIELGADHNQNTPSGGFEKFCIGLTNIFKVSERFA
eukprot:UN22105